ncbi:AAA family ATPase, partial [Phenylobacterium sp.]
AGRSVILDATFLDPGHRARASQLAGLSGRSLSAVWLEGPTEVLKARLAARTGDASDATPETLELQARSASGQIDWPRLGADLDATSAALDVFSRTGTSNP